MLKVLIDLVLRHLKNMSEYQTQTEILFLNGTVCFPKDNVNVKGLTVSCCVFLLSYVWLAFYWLVCNLYFNSFID